MSKKETLTKEEQEWFKDPEGELAVDVFQNDSQIVVQSAIAGVKAEDLDISIANDLLTIRGKRSPKFSPETEDYFWRECFWGNFSRSIILPLEVEASKIKASIENGVLTIALLKANKKKGIKVKSE